MHKLNFLFIVATIILSGCTPSMHSSHYEMISESTERVFTYDYAFPGKDKNSLWTKARDYFAETYGDSRAVFRVQDQDDGTLIGKGIHTWVYAQTISCSSEYHVRFAAKNDKARLQFELIHGAPVLSKCSGYPLPTKLAYQDLTRVFELTSSGLEKALLSEDNPSNFKDF